MAIKCPQCGAEYDVTLFTFGRKIRCDCGAWVDLAVGHQQASEDGKQPIMPLSVNERREEEAKLLTAIKDALPRLEKLWQQANSHWGYEDPVYRFYHQSMKIYFLQNQTVEIVKALQRLGTASAAEFVVHADRRWRSRRRVFHGSQSTLDRGDSTSHGTLHLIVCTNAKPKVTMMIG